MLLLDTYQATEHNKAFQINNQQSITRLFGEMQRDSETEGAGML